MSTVGLIDDPLKRCPRGCLFEAKHNFCPWHGQPLEGLMDTTIGEDFVIKRTVSAAGGFGVVYYARNSLGKNIEAAVKVLRPNACYDEEAIRNFVDEADRTFKLLKECPNTAKVLGVSRRPFPYIRMEYINGGSLYSKLSEVRNEVTAADDEREKKNLRVRLLPWREAYDMLEGIARALQHAHARELVHRDLKPHNVLIDRDEDGKETVKVVDWGISIARRSRSRRKETERETVQITTTRALPGVAIEGMKKRASQVTVKYAPPEFFRYLLRKDPEERNLKEVFDPRTDIYQFGLVAFELLTAEFPFTMPPGGSATEERFEHWREQHCRVGGSVPHRLQKYRSDFSQAALARSPKRNRMLKVINRCLEKEPAKRYANGAEVLRGLTEEPLWKTVTYFAATALLLAAMVALIIDGLTRAPPFLPDFWDAAKLQTQGVSAYEVKDAIQIGGSNVKRPVLRLWARGLGDLGNRADPATYTTGSLVGQLGKENGRVRSVELQRWELGSAGPPIVVVASDPDETLHEVVKRSDDRQSVTIDFSALCRAVRPRESAQASYIFSVDVEIGDGGSPLASYRNFCELRIDAQAPVAKLKRLTLVGGTLDGRAYDISGKSGLYVPEDYEDMEVQFDLTSEERLLQVQAKVRVEGQRPLVGSVSEQGSFRLGELGSHPDPTAMGTSVEIAISALDAAGKTAGEKLFTDSNTQKLEFDSGPGFVLHASREVTKMPELRVSVPLEKIDQEESKNYDYWLSYRDSIQPGELDAQFANVNFKLPQGVPRTLSNDIELSLYVVDTQLQYPGLSTATGSLEIARELIQPEMLKVPAEPTLDEKSFEISFEIVEEQRALKFFQSEGKFRWIAKEKRRFPTKLTLIPAEGLPIHAAKTRWEIGGKPTSGAFCSLDPPGGQKETRDFTVTVVTHWGTQKQFQGQIHYDEGLPFVESIELSVDGNNLDITRRNEVHTRNFQDLAFAIVPANADIASEDVSLSSEALGGVFERKNFQFTSSAKLAEGIYKIAFTLSDAFGNEKTVTKSLYVHRNAPEISIAGGRCREDSVNLPQCSARIVIKDKSGVAKVRIARDGSPLALDLLQVILEKAAGEIVDPRGLLRLIDKKIKEGTLRSVTLSLGDIDPGSTAEITVTAADHESGSGETTCTVKFDCPSAKPPPEVIWRGLAWVLIGSGEKAFYISKYEIPRWFWEGNDPPGEESAGWLPQTNVTPDEIEQFLMSPRLAQTYLPRFEEWKWVARGVDGKSAWVELGRAEKEFDSFKESLERVVNSGRRTPEDIRKRRLEQSLVPVHYRPAGLDSGATSDKLPRFYETLHFLGNAEEIVADGTQYVAVGGSAGVTLRNCIEEDARDEIKDRERGADALRGFRLVVYHNSSRTNGRAKNGDFFAAFKKEQAKLQEKK